MRARVAVVGCGWWATEAHLPAVVANPDAELAAVVDPDPDRLALAGARFGAAGGHSSVEEMLARVDVDCAIVAVPHHLHHSVAAPLLDAGVHVLVEKPLTIDPADAGDLVERARAGSVELLVGYPLHYNEHAAAARDAIASGRIGALELADCLFASVARELYRGNPERYDAALGYTVVRPKASTYSDPAAAGGGQGQTQLTHAAALLLWMTGLDPVAVAAFTAGFELEIDLVDAVSVRFGSGALGTLACGGGVKESHEELLELRLFGRDGHVAMDVQHGELSIHDGRGVETFPTLAQASRYPQAAPATNLIDVALGRAPNESPGALGARVVELIAAMYRSQDSEAVVRLPERA
jgi:predicted dehydrogenase